MTAWIINIMFIVLVAYLQGDEWNFASYLTVVNITIIAFATIYFYVPTLEGGKKHD